MKAIETHHFSLLQRLADCVALRFECPVYLVGSFIEQGLDAMDIDIVMPMSCDRAKRLFKSLAYNERRRRFNLKQKIYFEECLTDVDIDFKVQLEDEFLAKAGDIVKLDSKVQDIRKP